MTEQFNRIIVGLIALMVISSPLLITMPHNAYATSSKMGIMIPLYTYPTDGTWTKVISEKNAHPSVPIIVIADISGSGAGSSSDPNFVTGINNMKAAGITVLGYVDTAFGSRSLSQVKTEIHNWSNWYQVDGIFFDEMDNSAGGESYYTAATSYAKSLGITMTVGNPGTSTVSSYVGTVDNIVIYETTGMPSLSTLLSYTFNSLFSTSNFSFIAYSVGSLPSASYLASASNDVKYIYITNAGGSNPYDVLPSYFATEVADLDTGSSATAPGAPTGLAASGVSSSQINLSWHAPSSDGGSAITGYQIQRSANGGSTWSTIVSSTGSTSTTYSNSGLTASTTYTYHVSAINSVGTSSPSNTASATTNSNGGGGNTTGNIVLGNVQSTSGKVGSSPYGITLSNFGVGTGSDRLLMVGVSSNNNTVASVTFGGVPLHKKISSFYNNDAELWYLKNPSGTGNIVVKMSGSTSVVVGAYSFSGVNQTAPFVYKATRHNTSASSPNISMKTHYPNDWILDLTSIFGGSTLGSPTCTQAWNVNVPNAVTGASSTADVPSSGTVTCKWTASSADLWDDVAVELRAN